MKDIQYGWLDFKSGKVQMIFPSLAQVQMCSCDYFKKATSEGKGKIVKIEVTVVEEV